MIFYVDYEVEHHFSFDPEELAKLVAKAVLKSEQVDLETEVSLVLTDGESIRQCNKEFRNVDAVTDVLSFPAIDFQSPSDFSEVLEDEESYLNPDTDCFMLGDIMINVDRVCEQAKEYNHSEKREFAFLVAHSMLHLLGYDHMEEDERLVMEEKQSKILEDLGITRDNED